MYTAVCQLGAYLKSCYCLCIPTCYDCYSDTFLNQYIINGNTAGVHTTVTFCWIFYCQAVITIRWRKTDIFSLYPTCSIVSPQQNNYCYTWST